MKKIVFQILLAVVSIATFSCSDEDNNHENEGHLTVLSKQLEFDAEGGTKNILVDASGVFTATSNSGWCVPEVLNNLVRITVDAYSGVGKSRNAEVTIVYGNLEEIVTVQQLMAATAFIESAKDYIVIGNDDELDFELTITANVALAFETPAWITAGVAGETTATGEITYQFATSVLPDDGNESRTGDIVVKAADPEISASTKITVKQTKEKCRLRAATYNIYVSGWNERRVMVIDMFHKHDFDICGTQEGMNRYLNDITGYSHIGGGRGDLGHTGERVSIVYKTNRFEVLDNGQFYYSETPDVPSLGWDALQNRLCAWGKFRDLVSGKVFYFFNSHFENNRASQERTHLESAKLLLAKIEEITGGDYPVIVTGDFNNIPGSTPILHLLNSGVLRNARDISETPPTGPSGTFNSWTNNNPSSQIDWIMVTKDIAVKAYSHLNDRYNIVEGYTCPSDHDPVLAVVEF